MDRHFVFELDQFFCKLFIVGQDPAQPHEGPHDLDIDPDRTRAFKYALKHGHTLFGENLGQVLSVLSTTGL